MASRPSNNDAFEHPTSSSRFRPFEHEEPSSTRKPYQGTLTTGMLQTIKSLEASVEAELWRVEDDVGKALSEGETAGE